MVDSTQLKVVSNTVTPVVTTLAGLGGLQDLTQPRILCLPQSQHGKKSSEIKTDQKQRYLYGEQQIDVSAQETVMRNVGLDAPDPNVFQQKYLLLRLLL